MVKIRAQHPSPFALEERAPEAPPQQPITIDPQYFSFLTQQVQALTAVVQQLQKEEQ